MSANASVNIGDVLAGKYRVERILGAGGMGYVVAARHLQLDQLVAMKFLRSGAAENAEASARFLREAKAVVKLRNEHVAKVFDVGTMETGEPYIVMEHLEGCDLAALAKQRQSLGAAEASEYVIQACEALAEAHSLGIVHRDIKLANLFLTRGPTGAPLVKVLDFGISKMNPFGESEHEMTRTASMLGSPRFMSPEQMRDARAVDGRSDIWSLGVVLYRLVAGHPPFEANTLGQLLTMVMHEQQAPLSSACTDLPTGFDHVVARCLEKDPALRFANVAELAHALVPFCPDPPRARAAADRISAILKVRMSPETEPLSISVSVPSGRVSAPPGVVDTGTAAPWAGTGDRPMPASRSTTVWLGVGLASLLVGSAIFAMVRHDRATSAASAQGGVTPANAAAPLVSATAAPLQPDLTEPTPTGASAPFGSTAVETAVIPPPARSVALTSRTDARRASAAAATALRAKGGSSRPVSAPPPPTSNDDGIPTTRD